MSEGTVTKGSSEPNEDVYDEYRDEDQHFEWLSLSELRDDPENLREEYDGIEELAHSIKAQGLLQPIVVRRDENGQYFIKAGHRRKRALTIAGELKTRVIVDHRETLNEDVIATMLIENGHRKDLNPMEQAYGLMKIKEGLARRHPEREITDHEIAEKVGRTQVWVSTRLSLLGLSVEEQQLVREGRMTIGEGKRLGGANVGRVRPGAKGKKSGGYFIMDHELGSKAARTCRSLGHKAGGPNYVAIACGKCWERVIRSDEREKNRAHAMAQGQCGICGSQIEKGDEEEHNHDED